MPKYMIPPPPSGIGGNLRHTKTLTSAVTTAWGVDWDEVYIARDIMQNFFDANRGQLTDVVVRQDGKDVSISGPTAFNLERLFYLGSEKGTDDIGQYGEGFKVAATCLLRDHSVNVIAASGRDVLRLRIAEKAVRETNLYPVEYDFFESDRSTPGTVLLLQGCSVKLIKAIQQGLNHFFHENNPLLGSKRWEHYSHAFSLYDSTDGNGHVFYRKLKRGEFEGLPIVLVIDKEYGAIEKKIRKDRDRNAFGEDVMRMFFNHFARYGLRGYEHAIRIVVEKAKNHWIKGHPLLSEVADTVSHPGWSIGKGREVFADGYYAKSTTRETAEQIQFDALERKWRDDGKTCLPQYFRKFGVLNAQRHLDDLKGKAREEARRNHQRVPSRVEAEAIQLLATIMRELAPDIAAVFDRGRTSYTVAQTEALLGELRDGRGYRSREVFLAADVFTADFSEAVAVFLHEHAHIFGYDGHRGFTDALTELIETIVRHRRVMDEYEKTWDTVRTRVLKERKEKCQSSIEGQTDWLASKSEKELRELLRQIPAVVLRKLKLGEKDTDNAE